MQNEIAEQRAALDRTNDLGKVIIDNSSDNPLVVADVQGKLTKVRVQLDRLDARIEQRHAILQNILLQIQVYDVMFDEFVTKLAEMEDEVNNFRPISAILEIVSEQKEHIQRSISDNIARKEPVFEKILEDGLGMLERMEPGSEKDVQREKLEQMKTQWNQVKEKTAEMQKRVQVVHEASQKYDHRAAAFREWLQDAEKKASKINPVSCDENELDESLKELEAVASDIESHKIDFDELDESSSTLTGVCQADGDVIKADFNELKSRWEALQTAVLEKKAKVEEAKEAFEKYQSALQPVQEAFTQAEDALASHEPAGTDADKIRQELEQIKALVSTMDERKGDIKQLNQSGQQLLQQAEDDAPSTLSVKEQLVSTNSKSKDLPARLGDRQRELEKALEDTLKFNSSLAEIERWLPETVETVDALEPVSSEPEKLKEQIRETDGLHEEVKRYLVRLCIVEETGQRLIEDSMQNPDAVADIQNNIEKARQPLDKLNAKLEQRSLRLHDAMLQSQEFQEVYDDFAARLGTLDEMLQSQEPISPDYPTTRRQKDETEEFNDSIAQMQPVLEKLLAAGEKVLEASDPGEDRVTVQKKLDDLKEKWEDVKSKATERDESVSSVIPDAKSFHTGAQAFDLWLSETERKLAAVNTDSVSPEELSQQQKAFEDLKEAIESHRTDHKSLNNTADSLKDKCKDNSYFVEVQIKDINRRWEELLKDTETKETELQTAKDTVDEYLDALGAVEEVVQKAETTLECQQPTDLDITKSKEDLAKVQQVVDDLEKCEPRHKDMQELGEKLLQGMNPDSIDAVMLKQQLGKVGDSFTTALVRSRERKTQLEKIIVLMIEFTEKYEVLITWTEEITIVVETIHIIRTNPSVVKSQLDEIEHIQEDIVKQKYVLESADDAGQRLVECCDNEPAILMEVNSKVHKATASLELLSAKVDDQHKKLQEAVLQSQQFQETLDDFTEKLAKLEDDVAKMGPVSSQYDVLREQSEDVEHSIADVKQLEPVYERISKNADEILASLEPGEEKDELKERLSDLAARWNAVKEKVDDRKSKIDDVIIVARPHHDSLQSLLPWMSDAEDWVDSLEPVSCDEKCIAKEQKTLATLVQQLEEHKPEVDAMNDSVRELGDLCDDVQVVQAESKDANKRWQVLTANLTVRQQHLDSVARLLEQLTNQLQPIEERLDEAEALVDAPLTNLTDAEKGEQELRKIEVMMLEMFLLNIGNRFLIFTKTYFGYELGLVNLGISEILRCPGSNVVLKSNGTASFSSRTFDDLVG